MYQRVMIPDEPGCVIEKESISENEIGRGGESSFLFWSQISQFDIAQLEYYKKKKLTESDRVMEGQYFIGNWYHRTVTSCKRHRQPGVIYNKD
ncbi:hypothetical protein T4D_15765 [Trichinella pseudospiralis]|uniref:Uncharacterized protein n=1 Tax=Trichinella pseudospiralis TaxID=6337 RepID=A0A0V1FIZ0_TRIPS|nr:hypothetical protein T4D_15765 [Trichinella pseudospiralis]